MLMRYVKCQLMVLLFGGIVGPIFLAVGLARVPVVGEMFLWMGLAITVIDVIVALLWANYGAKSAAKHRPSKPTACSRWPASPAWVRRGPGSTMCPW